MPIRRKHLLRVFCTLPGFSNQNHGCGIWDRKKCTGALQKHRCIFHGKQTRLPVQRKGQAQQEHAVFSLQLEQAAAAGGDGLHTAAAVAVTRAVGYRKPLAHDNLALIRVLDFQQQLIEPHTAVQRDGPLLLVQPGHGAERVFQSVGQNGAQLGVWNAQRCGEAELRRQPDAVLLRLFRKRGAQQIDQLVFTVAPEATR